MVFKVEYLDKEALKNAIKQYDEDSKSMHSNRLISPIEREIGYYFHSKSIESDNFKIFYKNIDTTIIEISGEYIIPSKTTHQLISGWIDKYKNTSNLATDEERILSIITDPSIRSTYHVHFYSWNSIMDRIDIFEKSYNYDIGWNQGWKELKELDKMVQREVKINKLLK